jgi:hypothetical protein
LYSIRPKAPFRYPVWLRPFYLFAMASSGRGECQYYAEMRFVELKADGTERETPVGKSKIDSADLGAEPLTVHFISLLMPPVLISQRGVYRVYLICEDIEIGFDTIIAR